MEPTAGVAAASEPVIEVRDLVAHYGEREILHGVSLAVERGEIRVIMGGSGSGKSTLLRHLLGLERPTSGSIRVLGKEITRMSELELYELSQRIGVAFQGGALFSSMTVAENVMLPLRERTRLDRGTMEIMMRLKLQVVSLAEFEHLLPSQLSGGMVKRAAFARATIMDPAILFCDEPSAGLDPVVSSALDDLILRLRDAFGMTIVVVTHELESAFRIADRITVLDGGEILVEGSVAQVRESTNPRVQNLLQRRFEEEELDPDAYLERLTGDDRDRSRRSHPVAEGGTTKDRLSRALKAVRLWWRVHRGAQRP
jgi:phospholipid/cholesterol/gamma-HCH transport system ATP-binding protein